MSRVGVVVAAFQADRYLGAALDTLRGQSFADWECVVVDDGSTDGTSDVAAQRAAQDDRFRLVRRANGGVSAARNTGLAALGPDVELVALLDADDLYLPGALAALHDRLLERPDAVGAYGYADYVDEGGAPYRPGLHPQRQRDRRVLRGHDMRPVPPEADATFPDLVAYSGIWPSAVALHRRAVVERVGGLDPALRAQGDWDLYLRMSRSGPYAVLDRQVALYRRHRANLTGDDVSAVLAHDRVRRQAARSPDNTPAQRRVALRTWRHLQAGRVLDDVVLAARRARSRTWRPAGAALLSAAVHGWQLLHPLPPAPRRRLVELTRRHLDPAGTAL